MKPMGLCLVCALIIPVAGCTYRGAVYSEYTQFALDIRATQEAASPVIVNLGYDRGVLTYVPKRSAESDSMHGEAASVISWTNLTSQSNPTYLANGRVLRADAGFISGVAANVASAPEGATVEIRPWQLTTGFTPSDHSPPSFSVQTKGEPGKRIATAFSTSARFLSQAQATVYDLLKEIEGHDNSERLFEAAASIMPSDFFDYYQMVRAQVGAARIAFIAAKNRYLQDEPVEGLKHATLIQALKTVLR